MKSFITLALALALLTPILQAQNPNLDAYLTSGKLQDGLTAFAKPSSDADRFSLQQFNEPDGLAEALVKTIEYRAASPSALEEFVFYNHESVSHRVRRAMDWKAAHPKAEAAPPPAS